MQTWVEKIRLKWKQSRNQRLYRRLDVELPAAVFTEGKTDPIPAHIHNWSPMGLFVQVSPLIPIGSVVRIEFTLGEVGGSTLRLKCQVVRHQPASSSDSKEGIGLMFTDLGEGSVWILRDLLKETYLGKAISVS